MERLEDFFMLIDYILKSKRRKHITAGILICVGILFIGLALTITTTKMEDEDNE